ncbi:MAG: hypothetical protein ACK5KL_05255 [Dysgonomonas sp.]
MTSVRMGAPVPVTIKKIEDSEIALAVVEFRTLQSNITKDGTVYKKYNGEFGFDWLRINELGLTTELAYKNILKGGYKNDTTDFTDTEAFRKMAGLGSNKGEYEKIEIKRPVPSGGTASTSTVKTEADYYYVPYLNLYPKEYCDSVKYYKPEHKATLRVLVEIMEDLDRLEFEYNDEILDVTSISDTAKCNKQKSIDEIVTITCLKEINTKRDGVIRVYAYPQDTSKEKTLAGKIQVGINTKDQRKEIYFAFIGVRTNVNSASIPITGTFSNSAQRSLANTLHQALIHPSFIITARDTVGKQVKDSSGKLQKIILDLSTDSRFKLGGSFMHGATIHEDRGNCAALRAIKNQYDTDPLFTWYKNNNCYPIFAIGAQVYDGAGGQILSEYVLDSTGSRITLANGSLKERFLKCAFQFPNGQSIPQVIAHEALHGLILRHTHRDETPLCYTEIKYIFGDYRTDPISHQTDNIMSYNSSQMKSTWAWQWKIMRTQL